MQVHAVPETERAFDASGRQLPWGIEYAEYVRRSAAYDVNIRSTAAR